MHVVHIRTFRKYRRSYLFVRGNMELGTGWTGTGKSGFNRLTDKKPRKTSRFVWCLVFGYFPGGMAVLNTL